MAMGKRKNPISKQILFIPTSNLPPNRRPSLLCQAQRGAGRVEFRSVRRRTLSASSTRRRWAGRSLEPGKYFRLLLIGYFEGIDSERGIAWRCADSLSLRSFVGYALDESAPSTRRLAYAKTDRPGDAPGGISVGAEGAGRATIWSAARRSESTPPRWKPTRRCDPSCVRTRTELPGVFDRSGQGVGDPDTHAGRPGKDRQEAEKQGQQR